MSRVNALSLYLESLQVRHEIVTILFRGGSCHSVETDLAEVVLHRNMFGNTILIARSIGDQFTQHEVADPT